MISSHSGGIALALGCENINAAPLGEAWIVEEALTQVSSNAAGYRVLDHNGAIDLLPPKGATEGLLSTKVDKFDYDGQKDAAIGAIRSIQNFRDAAHRMAPNSVNGMVLAEPKIPRRPFTSMSATPISSVC